MASTIVLELCVVASDRGGGSPVFDDAGQNASFNMVKR
jgi:hypothetical protein